MSSYIPIQDDLLGGMLGNLPVIIYKVNKEGAFTLSVGSGLKSLGLSDNEVVGRSALDMYADAAPLLRKAMAGEKITFGSSVSIEGRELFFRSTVFPDPSGEGGIIGFVLDITPEKETALELLKARIELERTIERLDSSQEISQTGGWDYDVATDMVYRTKHMKLLLGITEDSTTLYDGSLAYDEESGKLVQKAMAEAVSRQKPYDIELRQRDGQKWYRSIGIPIVKDGKTVRVRGALMDITEIKRAAQQLMMAQREQERAVELLDVSQALSKTGGWEYDVIAGTMYRTRHMKLLQGLTEDVAVFRDWSQVYEDESAAALREGMAEAIEHQRAYDVELKERNVEKWYRSIGIPIVKDGKTIKIRGSLMDITEMKRTEVEILRAKQLAEEAVIAKQQFLSNMSHELRTPMNAVIGMTHLLLQENPRTDQIENLRILKFSGENLLSLINDILDYSKIEAGKIQFEEIAFNLTEFINNIKHSHTLRAEEKGLVFKIKMDSDLPEIVIGDPVRLSQILNNLVSNAVKFTSEGKVIVDLSLNKMDEASIYIDFSITDTGIGISPELQVYIFESFTQASADTTRRFGGTGLGLAITKRLLQLQGSEIVLESRLNKGSSFSFTLKFGKSDKRPQEVGNLYLGTQSNFENLTGRRILLVEDNEANTVMATKMMLKWGLEIDHAGNGVEAVEMVRRHNYDLVLMDLQMPVMDGYEASRRIRALPGERGQEIPIIALTASAMAEIKGKVGEAGMNDYISKPFNPSELYTGIARNLGGSTL